MARIAERFPIELPVVIPLAPLPDLAAHEQQLLARVREHVAVERAQVACFCQTSPGILSSIDRLPCTTSSCENGRMKFSLKA